MIGEWLSVVASENGSRPYCGTAAPFGLADREGGFLEAMVGTGSVRPKMVRVSLGPWQKPELPCKSLQDSALRRSPGTVWRCSTSWKQGAGIGAATSW